MKDLSEASVTELIKELRNRVGTAPTTIDEAELSLETVGRRVMQEGLETWVQELASTEDDSPAPCPSCGASVSVNARRQRTVHSMHGSFQYVRNQYYCRHCKHSFYPLDERVGAPEKGEGTVALSKRVTDFGINAPYEEAAERFSMHYGRVIPRRTRAERLSNAPHPEVVFVADGAAWIWKMQQRLYPDAIQILDWAHAVSHAVDCAKVLFDDDTEMITLFKARIETLLADGHTQQVLDELSECLTVPGKLTGKKAITDLIRYYRNHQDRMSYAEHRAAGRVIGSGIVESSHRHVLQTRMKRAGQHWSPKGAEKMARLRAVYKTVGPKDFYDTVQAQAA